MIDEDGRNNPFYDIEVEAIKDIIKAQEETKIT